MREEFEKSSRSSPMAGSVAAGGGPGSATNFDLAGWMAGTTSDGASTGREIGGSSTRRRG